MTEQNLGNSNIDNKLKLARIALENDNGEEALKYSSQVLESDTDNAEAWMIKGAATILTANGFTIDSHYQEAMSCFDRAKVLAPSLEEIETERAKAKEMTVNFYASRGSQNWDSAVQLADISARAGLGGYERSGNFPNEAFSDYEKALKIDPMHVVSLQSIIHICKELGKVELAAPYIEQMKKIDANFVAPMNRQPIPVSNVNSDVNFQSILIGIVVLLTAIMLLVMVITKK